MPPDPFPHCDCGACLLRRALSELNQAKQVSQGAVLWDCVNKVCDDFKQFMAEQDKLRASESS